MCPGVAAVNSSKDKSSDVQLREAAIQLAVFGVPLSDFDPWSLTDPHLVGRGGELTLEAVKKAKKGTLSLSAATFVAPRTIRATEAAMSDGYKISGNVLHDVDPDMGELSAAVEGTAAAFYKLIPTKAINPQVAHA